MVRHLPLSIYVTLKISSYSLQIHSPAYLSLGFLNVILLFSRIADLRKRYISVFRDTS